MSGLRRPCTAPPAASRRAGVPSMPLRRRLAYGASVGPGGGRSPVWGDVDRDRGVEEPRRRPVVAQAARGMSKYRGRSPGQSSYGGQTTVGVSARFAPGLPVRPAMKRTLERDEEARRLDQLRSIQSFALDSMPRSSATAYPIEQLLHNVFAVKTFQEFIGALPDWLRAAPAQSVVQRFRPIEPLLNLPQTDENVSAALMVLETVRAVNPTSAERVFHLDGLIIDGRR